MCASSRHIGSCKIISMYALAMRRITCTLCSLPHHRIPRRIALPPIIPTRTHRTRTRTAPQSRPDFSGDLDTARTNECLVGVMNGSYQAFASDRITLEFLANNYAASDVSLYVGPVFQRNPFSFAFMYEPDNPLRAFLDWGILQVLGTPQHDQIYRCRFSILRFPLTACCRRSHGLIAADYDSALPYHTLE